MAQTLLKVSGLQVAYGGIQAVKGIDFEVREGELVSLIGSNGAGKTTTMKAITGIQPINDGDIEYLMLERSLRHRGEKVGLHDIPHVTEIATRLSIAVDLARKSGCECLQPARNHSGVRTFGILPRPKNIEISQPNNALRIDP